MKPTFKTLDEKRHSRFEKEQPRRDARRQDENRKPRSHRDEQGERRPNAKKSPNFTASSPKENTVWGESRQDFQRASGEGSVKVSFKGKNPWEADEKVKKTGALSPRAPEKIKKNRAEEMKIYGENACLTLFQQRPEAIVRLWATVEGAKKVGELTSYLAANKKAYHVVDRAEMEKVTGTEHHGDLCLLVKKAMPFSLEGYLQVPKKQDCLVLLDGVNNAQNVGGVLRTCAFYGVKNVVVENADQLYSSAAARVAEGGLEFVRALETKHKNIALAQLRQAGYQIVHLTRQKQAASLACTPLAAKVVFVLSDIVARDIEFSQDSNVQLSFDNPLNSGLNVAVNAGILLNYWYQNR